MLTLVTWFLWTENSSSKMKWNKSKHTDTGFTNRSNRTTIEQTTLSCCSHHLMSNRNLLIRIFLSEKSRLCWRKWCRYVIAGSHPSEQLKEENKVKGEIWDIETIILTLGLEKCWLCGSWVRWSVGSCCESQCWWVLDNLVALSDALAPEAKENHQWSFDTSMKFLWGLLYLMSQDAKVQ